MRNLIFIFLFTPVFACGQLLPGTVASSGTSAAWTILHQWDFENWNAPMEYVADSITVDFNYNILDWAGGDSIVVDTINGEATQVLKIINESGEIQRGLQMYTWYDDLQTGYSKVGLFYNIKFNPGFEAISGNGKIPALFSLPQPGLGGSCPHTAVDSGFNGGFLYKAGIGFSDYNYTHNLGVSCPWTVDQHAERFQLDDSTYFIPGVWYNITQIIHLNTLDGSDANPDGINEVWVYDDMIFQMDTMRYVQGDTMLIDGLGFRNFQSAPSTTKESSVSIDNVTIGVPIGDSNFDAGTKHATSYKMVTPTDITDREVWYEADHYITTDDTITTEGYSSSTDPGHHEAWLFDAGEGNTITATFLDGQTGGADYIFFYDGNDADDPIREWQAGSGGDLTTKFGGDGVVTSTGRYLYMYTVNSEDLGFTKFRVKIEII